MAPARQRASRAAPLEGSGETAGGRFGVCRGAGWGAESLLSGGSLGVRRRRARYGGDRARGWAGGTATQPALGRSPAETRWWGWDGNPARWQSDGCSGACRRSRRLRPRRQTSASFVQLPHEFSGAGPYGPLQCPVRPTGSPRPPLSDLDPRITWLSDARARDDPAPVSRPPRPSHLAGARRVPAERR